MVVIVGDVAEGCGMVDMEEDGMHQPSLESVFYPVDPPLDTAS